MKPLVSVICLVYNFENFLGELLEGMVNQVTDFPFEVIIHDDASTDRSAEIITEYSKKYPGLFVPILQTQNQYSQGVRIVEKYILPLCRGQYIACCEGDDYWCDPNKLQMQVDYMRLHPECSLCVHDTELILLDGSKTGNLVNGCTDDCDYSIRDIISADSGNIFSNNSRLYRKDAYIGLPKEFVIPRVGDYPRAIYAASLGYVHYIGRVMSCYRISNPDSWTGRTMSNLQINLEHHEKMVAGLHSINNFFGKKYNREFSYPIGSRLLFLYRKKYGLMRLLFSWGDLFTILSAMPRIVLKKIRKRF